MKLSVVTVNWWSEDWLNLLLRSIKKTVQEEPEIVVVDNSGDLKGPFPSNVRIVRKGGERMHGPGMDFGIQEASGEYIFAVDVDAHFLLPDWDKLTIDYFDKKDLRLLACQGGKLKPIRPCGMLFKRDCFLENEMSFSPQQFRGVKFDVGILFYLKSLTLFGDRSVDFFPYQKTEYKGAGGSEYLFAGKRFLYHNYYGTRWYGLDGKRTYEKINRWTWEEYLKAKEALFGQIRFKESGDD